MSDCGCSGVSIGLAPAIDPDKRVKYTMGLVLGVDEFEQEQRYFRGRDQLQNRALHGYGTVCGLAVSTDPSTKQVTVSAGLAIDPAGRFIRVPAAQCASLPDWIGAEDRTEKLRASQAQNGDASVFVTLCYRECDTDDVPIPGAPCRTEDEAFQPSRVTETFQLNFSLEPPQAEEDLAIRLFAEIVRSVEIVDDSAPVNYDDVWKQLKDQLDAIPTMVSGEQSFTPTLLKIHAAHADELLSDAFQAWITQVRPKLLAERNCIACEPKDACLLLSRLDFTLDNNGLINSEISIDETDRPFLVQTRLLQELMEQSALAVDLPLSGDVTGPPMQNTVVAIQNTPVDAGSPDEGHVLTAIGPSADRKWAARKPPDLAGDVTGPGGANQVERIRRVNVVATGPTEGQALVGINDNGTIEWAPRTLSLQGDVTGAIDSAVVERLRGTPVNPASPTQNQVLTARTDAQGAIEWIAASLPAVAPPSGVTVVAAGRFDADGNPVGSIYRDLMAVRFPNTYRLYYVAFPEYDADGSYITKGTVTTRVRAQPHTLEVVESRDDELKEWIVGAFGEVIPLGDRQIDPYEFEKYGFVIRIERCPEWTDEQDHAGFMLEISLIP